MKFNANPNLKVKKPDELEKPAADYSLHGADSGYRESDAVKQAQQRVEQQQSAKPGAYQSAWQDQLNAIMDKILNREPFSYDLNGDALYQQYKDQYAMQGRQAMMDTMGQAQAMTGGYGNSYAQNAGQQAYQGYLQQMNDRIPELYQLALSRYQSEGDALMNQFSMLGAREDQDYGRYRDALADHNAELARLQELYDAERSFDYSQYADARDYGYQQERDAVADEQWQTQFDTAKQQWQDEFDESKRQWQASFDQASKKAASYAGGSGSVSSGSVSTGSGDEAGVVDEPVIQTEGVLSETGQRFLQNLPYLHAGGNIEVWKQTVNDRLKQAFENNVLSAEDVVLILQKLNLE